MNADFDLLQDNLQQAVCQEGYSQYKNFFEKLQKFRLSEEYCDVAVEISGVSRKCHSLVLAASSDLLHASLQSTKWKPGNERFFTVITLPSCFEVSGLDIVLDFFYSGSLKLNQATVHHVCRLARYLQIPSVTSSCLSLMKSDAGEVPQSIAPPVVRRALSSSSPPYRQASLDEDKMVSDFSNLTKVASDAYENLETKSSLKALSRITGDENPPMSSFTGPDQSRCPSCSLLCDGEANLDKHISRHHAARKYKCSHCPKSFKRRADAEIHTRRKHAEVKPFACDICSKTFSINSELVTHSRCHRDGFAFKCDECGKTFISELGYKSHMNRAHVVGSSSKGTREKRSSSSARRFQCGECGGAFGWPHLLRRHVEAVHMKLRPHKCSECGLAFHREEQLRQHSASHTGKQEYACQECGKSFRQKAGLSVHKKRHSDANKVVCDVCGYCCYSMSVLRVHQRTHTSIRPFTCDKCHKKFKTKKHLQSHLKCHNKSSSRKGRRRCTSSPSSSSQPSASKADTSKNLPPSITQPPHLTTPVSPLNESVSHFSPNVATDDDSSPSYVVLSSANLNHGEEDGDDALTMYLNQGGPAFGVYPDHTVDFGPPVEQTPADFLSSVFHPHGQPPS